VRLTFAVPTAGVHRFDIMRQGQPALRVEQPKLMLAETRTVPEIQLGAGSLTLTLTAHQGTTLLTGVELIRED